MERVQALLKGRDIDVKDIEGNTALLRAVEHGHEKLVDWLLQNGAKVSQPNNFGTTALHWCASKGYSSHFSV